MIKRLSALIVALTLVLSFAPSTSAYTLWPYRMSPSAVSNGVMMCFAPIWNGTAAYNNRGTTLAVVENAWEPFTAVDFQMTYKFCDDPTLDNENVKIRQQDWDSDGMCESPYMLTDLYTNGDWNSTTIWVNQDCLNTITFYFGTGDVPSDKMDGPSAIAHEMGHALGMCHSNAPDVGCFQFADAGGYNLMDAGGPLNADCTEAPIGVAFFGRRLVNASADDRNAIWKIYPAYAQTANANINTNCKS